MAKGREGRRRWKDLARKLVVKDSVLDAIEVEEKDDGERCYQALWRWQRGEGSAATVRKLLAALSDLGLGGDALEIAEIIAPSWK